MKILFHVPGSVVGGAETHVQSLINNLPAGNHALVTYEHQAMEKFLHKEVNTNLFHRVFSPNMLKQKIEQFLPDIIQFYHSPFVYNVLTKTRTKARVVEVAHNRTSFGWDSSTYGKEHTDVLVCVSPDAEEHFLSKRGDCRTVVIPNGVDTSRFRPWLPRPGVAKRPRPLGGFCGRLEGGDGKGVQQIIDIVRTLPVDFELVGYDFGGYGKKLRGTNIKVLPFTTDMTRYYSQWDFFVSCSPKEGFGLAIAEALASGLQVVMLDCGGISHYLRHDDHAYIAKDLEDVAKGVRQFIEAYRDGGPFYAPETLDLSAKTMATSYFKLYEELKSGVIEVKQPPSTLSSSGAVLGVVPESWYGIRHALEGRVTHVATPETALAVAKKLQPTTVVFGGFMPVWYSTAKQLKSMGCEVVVTYHSTPVLNEFGDLNRQGLVHIIDAVRKGYVDYISTPHEGMAKTFDALEGVRAVYEPNTIQLPEAFTPSEKLDGLHIGIFGTGMPWKNLDTQIMAAAVTPDLTKLHLQNLRSTSLVDQLGIEYKVHPYYSKRPQFYQLASSMRVNLAVGLTETFGYFAAESYLLGTPAIFSVTTPSMRGAGRVLSKALVHYIDDPHAIAEAVLAVLDDYDNVLAEGKDFCEQLAKKGP